MAEQPFGAISLEQSQVQVAASSRELGSQTGDRPNPGGSRTEGLRNNNVPDVSGQDQSAQEGSLLDHDNLQLPDQNMEAASEGAAKVIASGNTQI